jgi:hypothetical protein
VWAWGAGQSTFSLDGKLYGVWQGGNTWTKRYQLPGHSELSVREEWPTGKLLREGKCRRRE